MNLIIVLSYLAIIVVFNLFLTHYFMKPIDYETDYYEALYYIGNETEADACIISYVNTRATIPYLTKRHTYVAWSRSDRAHLYMEYLFSDSVPLFNISPSYIFLTENDFHLMFSLLPVYNLSKMDSSLYLLPEKIRLEDDYNKTFYRDLKDDSVFVVHTSNDTIEAFGLGPKYPAGYEYHALHSVFKDGKQYINPEADNKMCFYIGYPIAMFFNEDFCQTNIVKILTWQDIPGLEKFYRNDKARIYKIIDE